MYKLLIRPVLFLLPPEKAHLFTAALLRILLFIPGFSWCCRRIFFYQSLDTQFSKQGLYFPNRVGLAAGFDKDATFYKELSCFGFGFIEVGTVTPLAQPGNPLPRLFRLPEDSALINRMGFNNQGVLNMKQRLESRKQNLLIGGNIGKNKLTPNEQALNDYLICIRELYTSVDYFAINVSSPNTPGLRNLQEKEPLLELLNAIRAEAEMLNCNKPILLKIAPDLTDESLVDIAEVVVKSGIQGVIATNTTIDRKGLKTASEKIEKMGAGGLSGKPILDKSNQVIRKLRKLLGKELLIIGAGGIHSPQDAWSKIEAGADVIQIYTGFIYEGPCIVKKINKLLSDNLKSTNYE